MQFFLTENRLIKSCLILQPDLFYIYKLIIDKTGQYYIGVTKDLKSRIDNHGYNIHCIILDEEYESINFHKKAALALLFDHQYDGFEIERQIRKGISVQVLAVVHGRKYAYQLEASYIADNIADKNCLNEKV